jgi:hypothetical protein
MSLWTGKNHYQYKPTSVAKRLSIMIDSYPDSYRRRKFNHYDCDAFAALLRKFNYKTKDTERNFINRGYYNEAENAMFWIYAHSFIYIFNKCLKKYYEPDDFYL